MANTTQRIKVLTIRGSVEYKFPFSYCISQCSQRVLSCLCQSLSPQVRIHKFAEEHGFLDLSGCNDRPKVGDVVRIIPNHVCVVVNMVDRLIATRGGQIAGEIPVAARGRIS